jgi:hypothetical protein
MGNSACGDGQRRRRRFEGLHARLEVPAFQGFTFWAFQAEFTEQQ